MSKLFLTNLDLNRNSLLNAVIQVLAAAPSTPVQGQVYYDSSLQQLLVYNATSSSWGLVATNSLLLQGQNGAYYLARGNATGTQLASTISNLNATVVGYTLDTFAAPVANLNLNSQKITNLANPTNPQDAATKAYVDATIQGLVMKPTATVATVAALPANTYSNGTAGVGATLTGNSAAILTVDGYAVQLGDLVLVKNEAAPANNGLYNCTTQGTGSVPYVLTRNVDMNSALLFAGGFLAVENKGSTTGNTLWLCNITGSITVSVTPVTFTQLNSATSYTAGNGINVTGLVVSAVAAPGGGLSVGGTGIAVDNTVARSYKTNVGDGSSTSIVITHSLAAGLDVHVALYTNSGTGAEVECDVQHTNSTQITLVFATAPTLNQYRVVVIG